jgi:hypothetical protein
MARHPMRILAVAVCLLGAGCSFEAVTEESAHNPDREVKKDRVDALIRRLGHDKFAMREAAGKELKAMGESALPALREAAKSNKSVEIRRRAEQLIRAIELRPVKLASAYVAPGLPLAESKHPVCLINIVARVNARGEGKGKIELIVTPPNYDEYGDLVTGTEVDGKARPQKNEHPAIVLDCTIEFVKTGVVGRVNTPSVNRSVFRIKGPNITSAFRVATTGPGLTSGRLLVLGKDERVEYVVELTDLTPRPRVGGAGDDDGPRPPPCHPGCFPAGTRVRVPDGTKPIERVRVGDRVISIDTDGRQSSVKVTAVFVTRNRLLEVRTQGASLLTTQTQPVGLEAGGFRPAGELKPGDRVWRWVNGKRQAVKVLGISSADREAKVFNLVLGGTKGFVAEEFVVRSKPPLPTRANSSPMQR